MKKLSEVFFKLKGAAMRNPEEFFSGVVVTAFVLGGVIAILYLWAIS